ncbi:sigma-B regulation protein RsbQ [Arcticibacter pallidicorallinus]|uniref:Sigma-B regulation protein RsbQ n=1 Tax=Arcticibacter pallidicorallinus TaxID=1259464 RepID=A0A2T0UBC8_9SPHI|nr:alpha/beta hydrolase [Arcticibacter pallidicorallinus]PRY55178.1 sigma-B regulation protein RsbQ [Arcticibacter pallidicorallinus]
MVDVLARNNVRITGKGEQIIMFAHGFGCDQNVWRYLLRDFEKGYTTIVFDFVGSGQSDLAAYDSQRYSSLDGYALDVIEILETLNLKNVVFIGHSVACMIGMKAAIVRPEYFGSLIFVAPSPCYIIDESYNGGMQRADLEALFEVMDSNYLGWSSSMAPLIMGNPERPELGEELTDNFCATDPDIAREFARVTFLSDNRADLKMLETPSLTLQCSSDMLAPIEVGHYIHENTANSTLAVLSATGHCPHMSHPEETIRAIRSYINDHGF